MGATIDRDAIGTNTSRFSGHLPFIFLIKIIPSKWQHTELCLDIYLWQANKLHFRINVLFGGSHIDQPFVFTGPFNMGWSLQKYLEFIVKNLGKKVEKTRNFVWEKMWELWNNEWYCLIPLSCRHVWKMLWHQPRDNCLCMNEPFIKQIFYNNMILTVAVKTIHPLLCGWSKWMIPTPPTHY